MPNQSVFSWKNLQPLLGLPYADARIQDLFARAGLRPDSLLSELRVGIDSMPPHDQEPASMAQIDLTASYHVRLRFKHATEVIGANTEQPDTFVFATVTYFLAAEKSDEGYQGGLPAGIELGDSPERVIERVGRLATEQRLDPKRARGYVTWKDQSPVLHVLFDMASRLPSRVTAFLASVAEDEDE